MKKVGKVLIILMLLVTVASCFVACGEVSKRVECPSCHKTFNYATIRKHVNCPYCGYPIK